MNKETINLPRLISEVAAGASVDPATARRFLHELFAVIESSLKIGETVTLKGIGTFVRSEDSEHPVLFQPDEELAAIANEPFAAFSAVELNDGAAEEILAAESATTSKEEPGCPASEPIAAEVVEVPAEPEVAPVIAEESKPVDIADAEPEQPAHDIIPEPIPEAPAVQEQNVNPEPEQPSEEASDIKEVETEAEIEAVQAMEAQSLAPEIREIENREETEHKAVNQPQIIVQQEKGNTSMWLVLGILIGLIIGLVGGYFAGETMAAFKLPGEDDAEEDYEEVELYEPQSSTPLSTATPAVATPVQEAPKAEAAAPAAAQQPEKTTAQAKAEPVYDTITSTRYLSILARDHYGSKNYWVFIYQANPQLGDPNKVSPGTRVLIPAKESFMESTREATDAKARKLLNELAKKYKL